jgi:6-pyruvoyltetrahydropterin/6-carboxytetrahydropterin synthase
MLISKKFEIEMGHRLHNYKGKCNRCHGHRYEIEVDIEGEINHETGMVYDLSEIKKVLVKVFEGFDHWFYLYEEDEFAKFLIKNHPDPESVGFKFISIIPTVENLVMYWTLLIESFLPEGLKVTKLVASETSTGKAAVIQ